MQKNKLLFILLFLFFFLISFSCKRKPAEIVITPDALKNHLQNARLYGNVKNIETSTYYYASKDSSCFFFSKTIQCFSSDGYLTQVIIFDKNNDTVSLKKIYYLPNVQENYWEEVNFIEKTKTKDTFLYDKNGFKKEEWLMVNDSILYKIQYKTDGIGGIIEMKRLLHEYYLTNKIYYNDKGLVERIEEYDPNLKIYKYFTIEYDNYGVEVNRRAFKANNDIIEYTYTQYNNDGLLVKVIFEDRLHNYREDRIYIQHDTHKNWLEEVVMQGDDTLKRRVRQIEYY